MSSKGSIMDRAAKLSKEKTYSLWKFEQKLLMNFAEFYWTTRFVGLLFCQVNNYWIFQIRVEVNCPNVQPFFKLLRVHSPFQAVLKVHLRLLHIAKLTDFLFFILAAFYKLVWFILFYWLLCSPHCPFSYKKVYYRIWPNVR